nr:MAG TPA: hypothetical protein [Caudoviricetes sp.]
MSFRISFNTSNNIYLIYRCYCFNTPIKKV